MAGEFHLTGTQCAPAPRVAPPTQKKADQLPHGVQAETAGHDRVAGEVAVKKPEVGVNIEFGNQFAFARLTPL